MQGTLTTTMQLSSSTSEQIVKFLYQEKGIVYTCKFHKGKDFLATSFFIISNKDQLVKLVINNAEL